MSRTPDTSDSRADRLAAALRENLKRRKAQAKGRSAEEHAVEKPASEERGAQAPAPVAPATPAVDSANSAVTEDAGRIAAPLRKR